MEAERASPGALLRAGASLWGAVAARTLARPLEIPSGMRVIAIGSAVLGGAGKTPVAQALSRELSRSGSASSAECALVCHAYRASPGRARVVEPDDLPWIVGDDALASARALEASGVPVIVAPTRSAALALARSLGRRVAVVDGLIQASPARVSDAVLVLDSRSPWGSRRCPPLGDLRAPEAALLAAVDHVVVVTDSDAGADAAPPGSIRLESSIEGASARLGPPLDLDALRRQRVGLVLGVARPERVVRSLARRGIHPRAVIALGDHASFRGVVAEVSGAPRVDLWLTTARCATKLPPHLGGCPVLALDHRIDVGPLTSALA